LNINIKLVKKVLTIVDLCGIIYLEVKVKVKKKKEGFEMAKSLEMVKKYFGMEKDEIMSVNWRGNELFVWQLEEYSVWFVCLDDELFGCEEEVLYLNDGIDYLDVYNFDDNSEEDYNELISGEFKVYKFKYEVLGENCCGEKYFKIKILEEVK